MQEGQVWEAAMFAGSRHLQNLIAVIDRNELQIDGPTALINDPGNIGQKFADFGWSSLDVDGHDLEALSQAFAAAKNQDQEKPFCIVAHTIKGKGVSFMEGQYVWHGKAPNAEQCALALEELQLICGTDGGQR